MRPGLGVIIFFCGLAYGTAATKWSWPVPLPERIVNAIQTPLHGENDAPMAR